MRLRNGLDQGQAEPGAPLLPGAGVIHAEKGLKNTLAEVCRSLGVRNVLVEQDNAVDAPDPFVPMRESFLHLRPMV